MKKKDLKNLSLKKRSISNLSSNKITGGDDAKTCEAPCIGGTGSCNNTPKRKKVGYKPVAFE